MDTLDSDPSAQVRGITQCSICLEIFQDPKVLPCIHTFCLHCLESLCKDAHSGQEAACPLCKKVFSIPTGGAKEIPTNFFMNQLLQVNQSTNAEGSSNLEKSKLCKLCSASDGGSTAAFFCMECDQNLCDKCSEIHRKLKTIKSHQVIAVDNTLDLEIRKMITVNYCEVHSDKQVELYCNDCHSIACVTCHVEKHKKHECVDLKASAEILSQQLTIDMVNVSACSLRCLRNLEDLEINKNHFLENIEAFKVGILKKLETLKDEVGRQKVIMDSYTRYCREMKDKGTAYDISRAANGLHCRAEELLKTEVMHSCPNLSDLDIAFASPSAEAVGSTLIIDQLFSNGMTPVNRNTNSEDVQKGNAKISSAAPGYLMSPLCDLHPIEIEFESFEEVWFDAAEPRFDARAVLDKPELLHTMPGNGSISGITVLGDELFVVRGKIWRAVDIYNVTTYAFHGILDIPDSKTLANILCSQGYLFITSCGEKEILKYDYQKKTYSYLAMSSEFDELSIAINGNIIATSRHPEKIEIIDPTSGALIKEVHIDSTMKYPNHCVELSSGYYAVSHGSKHYGSSNENRLCILDSKRRIQRSYGSAHGAGVGQLSTPSQIVKDNYENIMVVDSGNNRIVVLSRTLAHLGYIEVPGHKLDQSCCLYLDEINHRLYIGENKGGRLFVLTASNRKIHLYEHYCVIC